MHKQHQEYSCLNAYSLTGLPYDSDRTKTTRCRETTSYAIDHDQHVTASRSIHRNLQLPRKNTTILPDSDCTDDTIGFEKRHNTCAKPKRTYRPKRISPPSIPIEKQVPSLPVNRDQYCPKASTTASCPARRQQNYTTHR